LFNQRGNENAKPNFNRCGPVFDNNFDDSLEACATGVGLSVGNPAPVWRWFGANVGGA